MILTGVDQVESIRLQKRYIRKESTQRQMCSKSAIDDIADKQSDVCDEISSTEEEIDTSDDDSDDDGICPNKNSEN